MQNLEKMVSPLLSWYESYKRDLPWRKDNEPYHIWISEIMLQQTRVEAAKEYYNRFLFALPTIQDLAHIDETPLLKLWEGLGYYSRAKNLKKAANIILAEYQGEFPHTYQELLGLPGIGPYTAGAIASICFHEKVPAVDGNVLRVLMRYQNCDDNIDFSQTKNNITEMLKSILPNNPGTFNQALMELGALVCIPNGDPNCFSCPLRENCLAFQNNTQLDLPKRNEKKKRKILNKTIFVFINDKKEIAIQKRIDRGLLANFYEFPYVDKILDLKELSLWLKNNHMESFRMFDLGKAKHIFTHLEWHMQGYLIYVTESSSNYKWETYNNIKAVYPIPSAYQYFKKALEERNL